MDRYKYVVFLYQNYEKPTQKLIIEGYKRKGIKYFFCIFKSIIKGRKIKVMRNEKSI